MDIGSSVYITPPVLFIHIESLSNNLEALNVMLCFVAFLHIIRVFSNNNWDLSVDYDHENNPQII